MFNRIRQAARAATTWFRRGVSIASEEAAKLLGYYRPTLSGVTVTDDSALESPEYFAGIRNIAEDLATLPLFVYRRLSERKREMDMDHPLFPILHDQVNEEMDTVVFVEMQQAHLMIRRNCYAEIQRTNGGKVVGLWPIQPKQVQVVRINGELAYRVNLPSGERDRETGLPYSLLHRERMLHVKAFSLDGVQGLSSTTMHREALGVSLALDRYGAAFFGNSASPEGVYTVPTTLDDEQYVRLRAQLESRHGGMENKHRLMLLEQGTTFAPVSVPNDKAQFTESKKMSISQMARLNRIAPHKIGDLSDATFSNIEHQGIDYVVSSIRPWAVRWERAFRMQLMTPAERRTHFAEFLLEGLLRGDAGARNAALQIQRQNGIINADEWREVENRNEIPGGGGKIYMVNSAMVPLDEAGRPAHTQPSPAKPDAVRIFKPLLQAAAERCLLKEAQAVRKAAERMVPKEGLAGLDRFVNEFYAAYPETVRQSFVPIAIAIGEALRGATGPDLSDWAYQYASRLAGQRAAAAREQLRAIVGSSNLIGAVVTITDQWTREEPTRLASHQADALVSSLSKYLSAQALEAA